MHPETDIERRAAGSAIAAACGDALGAGYEFGPPLPAGTPVELRGGGPFDWAPGEWTDDTAMAVPILRVVARGDRLEGAALDEIAAAWIDWAATAKDVGAQTRTILNAAEAPTAAALTSVSAGFAAAHEHSAGNGSLMRTWPVALAYLDDEAELVEAARRVSALTHADPLAGDACVLWSCAIRLAVLTGQPYLRDGLAHLPAERREYWAGLIDAAQAAEPADFPANGWAGGALQAAWSAMSRGRDTLDVLERAVRGGNDTDTVAAIAGGLRGAWETGGLPLAQVASVHGWPGLTADELASLAVAAVRAHPLPPSRPEPVLLQAVKVLHDRGYEGLRINPTFYATGHWRCSLRSGEAEREIHLRYSNGLWWDVLNDGHHGPVGPDALADRLVATLPSLESTRRPNPAYRFWYAALLEHLGDDAVPYLYDDHRSPFAEGRMGVTGAHGEGLLREAFPLPPA